MPVHNITIPMPDGAPCSRSKIVSECLGGNYVMTLDLPGINLDLKPMGNLWAKMNDLVAEQQTSKRQSLINTIKEI